MLNGLDAIDWSNLKHAYGSAEDVPDQIRGLASSDSAARQEAAEALFGNIHHQGTVYEATAHAVPFLISLLADTGVADRPVIAHLLGAIAGGSSYLEVHAPDTADCAALEREIAWVRAAREAVAARLPTYLALIRGADRELALSILCILLELPEQRSEIVPTLQALLGNATDSAVRLGGAAGLCLFGDRSPTVLATLRLSHLGPAERELARASRALCETRDADEDTLAERRDEVRFALEDLIG